MLLGLIFAGSAATAQRQAWMQGYMMGQMAGGTGSQQAAPILPYLYGGQAGPWSGGFGSGSPLLLIGGILLLFIGLRFLFDGPGRRHGGSQPGGTEWAHAWRRPPWCERQAAPTPETPAPQPATGD
jgi:hypothetical protein